MEEKKEAFTDKLNYYVLITAVKEEGFESAVTEFARYFNLDSEVAQQILKSSPIIFLANVSRKDLKALKNRLVELSSKVGIEFTVSSNVSPAIPRVVWPTPPHYLEATPGKLVRYVDFQWRGNAFVCPNCGETFLFQRVGNPFSRYLQLKQVEMATLGQEVSRVAKPVPVKAAASSESDVMELTPIDPEGEAGEEVTAEPIDILEPEPIGESPESTHIEEAEENPELLTEEPAVEEASCNVFLSALSSEAKKETAAKIIAEIKNIPIAQAKTLTTRILVPVLKDVTETEAKTCLEKFKKAGISGRITKK